MSVLMSKRMHGYTTMSCVDVDSVYEYMSKGYSRVESKPTTDSINTTNKHYRRDGRMHSVVPHVIVEEHLLGPSLPIRYTYFLCN